jgi:hypothetical protein
VTPSTLPVVGTTSTTDNSDADTEPNLPDLAPGKIVVVVDGREIEGTLSRENGQLTIQIGASNIRLVGVVSGSGLIALDSSGNIRVNPGDAVQASVSGFAAGSELTLRLKGAATPVATASVGDDGSSIVVGQIPAGTQSGDNTLELRGDDANGDAISVAVGIAVGQESKGGGATTWLIGLPVAIALLAGLFLPAILRRRRDDEEN